MPTLTDLQDRLRELNERFRRPGLPDLELSQLYDLGSHWPNRWPGAASAGVYVFIGPQEEVLYVGKASCGATLGSRLGTYFGHGPDGKVKLYNEFYQDVRHVATIPLPQDHQFEAPAVEEFLISRLGPVLNKVGRRPNL